MYVALTETGQRTGMGDIAETDEKTLFSEAYLLHKISMCAEKRNKYCSLSTRMDRTHDSQHKNKQTNSMWSNIAGNDDSLGTDGGTSFC